MTTTQPAGLRRALLWTFGAYVLFLAVVLLFPRGEMPSTSVSVITDLVVRLGANPSFVTETRMEVGLNVLIMVPLALLGRLLGPGYSWKDWTAVGFVVAVSVELLQGLLLPERAATALDVVANTTGVAVGAMIGSALRVLPRRPSTGDGSTSG